MSSAVRGFGEDLLMILVFIFNGSMYLLVAVVNYGCIYMTAYTAGISAGAAAESLAQRYVGLSPALHSCSACQ